MSAAIRGTRFGVWATAGILATLLVGSGHAQRTTLAADELAPMPTGRMAHWQLLLPSGKIASIGGHGPGFVALGTADIYDPQANTWSTLTMPSIHSGAALARLSDGRFLLAGSEYDGGTPASAGVDIFDPEALQFTAVAPLNRGRMFASGATLKGEETIAFRNWNIGAVQNGPTAPTSLTLADSTVVAYMNTYHWNNAQGATPGTIALRAADSTIYGPWQATGAPGQGGVPNAVWEVRPMVTIPAGTYEVIDSDTATWSQNGTSEGRGFAELHAASSPGMGKVLVVGAWYSNEAAAIGEVYDPNANTWTDTGALLTPRCLPFVVALDDGSALVLGGTGIFGGAGIDRVERYNPADNSFTEVSSSLFPDETGWSTLEETRRSWQEGQTLADGRILLFAYRGDETQLFTVNPMDGTIAKVGPVPFPAGSPAVSWFHQQPLIDRTRGFAIMLGYDTTAPRAGMVCRTISLDGSTLAEASAVAAVGAWPLFASRTLMPDGTVIQTGGHLSDNFDAVPNTYRFTVGVVNPPPKPVIEPVLHVRVTSSNNETHNYRYVWTGPAGEGPVTHGPTANLDDMLTQDPPNITFDSGDAWTVDVYPIGDADLEGTPARAAFHIGPQGEVVADGWVIN